MVNLILFGIIIYCLYKINKPHRIGYGIDHKKVQEYQLQYYKHKFKRNKNEKK